VIVALRFERPNYVAYEPGSHMLLYRVLCEPAMMRHDAEGMQFAEVARASRS